MVHPNPTSPSLFHILLVNLHQIPKQPTSTGGYIPLYPILPPTPQVTSPLHRLHRRRRQDGAEPSWDSHPIGPMEQLMVKSCTEGFTRPGKH